ncbi:MAG: hypothetical protein LBU81_05380 [Methanosarcinales archaeon]|jgi:hypothetical protein|nr:hypothetical protein [Methanosarcinales archaeon]
MLLSCKFCVSESGRCSHPKITRYSHCPYSYPEKCNEYELKREYFGITDYADTAKTGGDSQ